MSPVYADSELNLTQIIGVLEVGKGDFTKHLRDLKSILTGLHKADYIDQLDDKIYHRLCEIIFRIVIDEKRKQLAPTKSRKTVGTSISNSQKGGKAAVRLELCADVIYAIVQAGAGRFKKKTAEALIAHIIDTIPTSDGDYFQLIAPHYLKALGALLDQATIAERLKEDVQANITDFCLDGIEKYIGVSDGGPLESSTSFSNGTGTAPLMRSSSGLRGTPSLSNSSNTVSKQNAEELCQILYLLYSSTSIHEFTTLERVADTLMRLLRCQSSNVSKLHQSAFSVVNIIMSYFCEDKTSFSLSIGRQLLPLMCRLWQGKAVAKDELINSVRDEMLVSLYRIHLHLENEVRNREDIDLSANLEELLDILRSDYSKRADRDQLQLDDVEIMDLSSKETGSEPFRLNLFRLRSYNNRAAERNWATLLAIAILENLVEIKEHKHEAKANVETESVDHRRKRQRVPQSSERLAEFLKPGYENARLAGLQILLFVLQDCNLPSASLKELLDHLNVCASDKRSNVASWALLCIASCAYQPGASSLSTDWIQLWHSGTKSLTFTGTCRAAALQLHSIHANRLVEYRDIEENVNAIITAADISGPPVLCDSSAFLMQHLLQVNVSEAPGASLSGCHHVVRWLFGRWNPADRLFIARYGTHVHPSHIVALLRTSLGLSRLLLHSDSLTVGGPLAQAWQQHLDNQELLRYVLLLDPQSTNKAATICQYCPNFANADNLVFRLDGAHFHSTQKLILEFLSSKCSELLLLWRSLNSDRSPQVSIDMYRGSVNGCLTGLLLLPHFVNSTSEHFHPLKEDLRCLTEELLEILRRTEVKDLQAAQEFADALLQTVRPSLVPCDSMEILRVTEQNPQMLNFLALVAREIKRRRLSPESVSTSEEDPMDLDDEMSDQRNPSASEGSKINIPRRTIALDMSLSTFYLDTICRLMLIAALNDSLPSCTQVPSSFVDELISMKHGEILSCRKMLHDVLSSDLLLNVMDAQRLLKCLGSILASNDFSFSEVAMCTCLDVLVGLLPLWSSDEHSEIGSDAKKLYDWFIALVYKGTASTAVQLNIVGLLLQLLRSNQNYGAASKSPRTSLLQLLETGSASTKFLIGNSLSDIFELFTLKEHDKIFVDVLGLLPSKPDDIEGLAFRMYVLAKLASRWSTLLRRCIYHIFETPGKIPHSVRHATRCISDIASALTVESPKGLFRLFAPQILYTWLETEGMDNIPFQIFGFATLREMFDFAQEEASALLMMRGQDSYFEHLAELLQIAESELLQKCFSRIVAYTIATDMGKPPPSSNEKHKSGEFRLRKRLGKVLFMECINQHFADILAILFNIIDQEKPVEKSFAKDENLVYAAEIMEKMKSYSSSEVTLPPNQQPSFKANYLTSEITHLCSRTVHQVKSLYTPSLVTFIARKLLKTIHPALGSLHACSVLRKIRVLISLAGDAATQGYPLEMLLRSIRPFITDPECADDSIGILQYLLNQGSVYLSRSPSFVASITLSILGSLRVFMQESKSSTTQESQHQATMSKAQTFHSWVGKYASEYQSPDLVGELSTRFKSLVASARMVRDIGNADIGTTESTLLDQLLNEDKSDGALLSPPARKLALGMLCSEFKYPSSFRNDMYGEDQHAVANAALVWESCNGNSTTKQYLSWAARVLGRAFAATGHVHQELLQESSLSKMRGFAASTKVEISSRACILSLLQSMVLGDDRLAAGLAETALRIIVTTSEDHTMNICRENMSIALFEASTWNPYPIPPCEKAEPPSDTAGARDQLAADSILLPNWLRELSIILAEAVPNDSILYALTPVLQNVPDFAEQAFPFILHLVLSTDFQSQKINKKHISTAFMTWFSKSECVDKNNLKSLINSVLYLRTQELPREKSPADRLHWLDLDYLKAATAAMHCGMFKTALIFVEEHHSMPLKTSRRSSMMKDGGELPEIPTDMLLAIFQNIDDPDLYYGVQQTASLSTILARLEYEKDGHKSLAFRGARYDNHVRLRDGEAARDAQSLVNALDMLSLSGLSHSFLQAQQSVGVASTSLDSMFRTARKLEQWDIPVPSTSTSHSVTIYKAFQATHAATNHETFLKAIDEGLENTMERLVRDDLSASALHESLRTLAALSEMDEVLSSQGSEEFEETMLRFQKRSEWMKTGRFEDISQMLSCRGTTLSTLSQQPRLRDILKVSSPDTRLVEVQVALMASSLNRAHGAYQESLSLATSLIDLVEPCHSLGLEIEAAVHMEAADALWDQGEMPSSIGMLQTLDTKSAWKTQTIPVGRPDLLSKIGYQVSVARLENPDRIIEKYLKPALRELKRHDGKEAAQVFHQFAVFCDQQLQDPDSLEDLARLKNLSRSRANDVADYDALLKKATSTSEKSRYRQYHGKAKTWQKLDEQEYRRHCSSRDEFLRQCLENYLLSLSASDSHDKNALRFTALWLEHSAEEFANAAVEKYLADVPSRKFAPLMNQLSSRLLHNDSKFQTLLFNLVVRISTDHPYHGMYQIYAGSHSRPNSKDEIAVSRHKANNNVAKSLESIPGTQLIWQSMGYVISVYVKLAGERDEHKYKAGKKLSLFKDSIAGAKFNHILPKHAIPPPTMNVDLSADKDYSKVPKMIRFDSQMTIASGVSAPKIITALADNGARFRQLVKGGNDDLRQDAIMEQVFAQVSELLKINRSTRQRNLSIRTYKVLPLTSTAGVIEFVKNTIPLHEYLMPAHERFYPKDLKGNQCRKEIGDVQTQSIDHRVKKFRYVTERFHPVMHYFFTEHFTDPDEWFIKRLAYTRSTAAISILGHVLGLGDRHGHNILLDTESGEVVHIDLGVAFEMGRVLPVPELVPFRLTRDIEDGMGITKVEGVFRRCCEFTLSALRKEVYSIMTILDVLRYDPLYSWSISPVRLAKLQEAQSLKPEPGLGDHDKDAKQAVNQPSEADRALTVVNKKLSKTLSVEATVAELINQARNERNLAVLYSGWAAYA